MTYINEISDGIIPDGYAERVNKSLERVLDDLFQTARRVLAGEEVTRNELARLAGVASTSVKAALDGGKKAIDIAFPPPKASVKTVKLTVEQIAAIKAAGIEI